MEKFIIIGDTIGDFDVSEEFGFLSHIYLHSDAETINGYDCCYGNIPVFKGLLNCHLFSCEVHLQDGNIYDAIVIPTYTEHRIKALVCLCTDIEGIKHAIFEYFKGSYIDTCIEDSVKSILFKKYPEIMQVIKEYNLNH